MTTTYPGILDAFDAIPSGGQQNVGYGGRTHSQYHTDESDAIEAIEAKLGIGASVAAANQVLRGTAAGATAFGQVQAGDLTPGTSTMLKIGEVAGTGASGVLEIAGIPSTYRSLMLQWVGRSTGAVTTDDARLTFETTPTPGAYAHQYMYATGTTFTAAQNPGTFNFISVGFLPGASSTANLHASGRIEVPEYANAAVHKTTIAHNAGFATLVGSVYYAMYVVGAFLALPAINRVRLTLNSGFWTTTSRMTLYGLPA